MNQVRYDHESVAAVATARGRGLGHDPESFRDRRRRAARGTDDARRLLEICTEEALNLLPILGRIPDPRRWRASGDAVLTTARAYASP
jgi:hypothetical protein